MALVHFREAPFPASEMRLQINTPPTRAPTHFALSPDGRYIVFVASSGDSQSLWLRPLDKIEAKPIPGTDGAQFPFWSPDSQSVGFCAEGKLKRVNVSGGPPLTLANAPVVFGGGSWNGEGTILFGPHNSPILRVPASGGDPTGVTRLDTPRKMIGHRSPVFLPDDRHFLFLGYSYSGSEAQAVYLGSLEGGEPKRVMASETAVQYLEPDWVVYIRQGVLMARRFDPVKGELTGDPVTVADSVGFEVSSGAFSVSNTGLLAYRAGHEERRQLTWVDRTGRILGVAGEPDANNLLSPELSPDGRRIAIDRTIGNNRDLWLMDLVSGGLMRLTSDVAMDANPLWSPDGKRIVFHSTRNGTHDIWIKPASGTGTEQLLLGTPHNEWPLDWSDDGRFLLFNQDNPATGTDLWALPMTGNNRTPIVVSNTAFEERQGRFSPDGHWVAYETDESGTGFEIVVQAFPVRSGKWQVSAGGGFQPRWRADVKELYFIAPDGRLMAVPVGQRGSEFEAGKPVPLFETHMGMGTATFRAQYTVWRDGRFLISQVVEESSAVPITLILNWNPAQRK